MAKFCVSELQGSALDRAVNQIEECCDDPHTPFFSTNWAQGGPIIEREWLDITPWPNESNEDLRWQCKQHDTTNGCTQYGSTPLIAAMRCYVASKLGEEVEVPDEIVS